MVTCNDNSVGTVNTNIAMASKKGPNRVPLEVSIHWGYLHQDGCKTWKDISHMKNYSKATISRHMKKSIGDTVIDKRVSNKGRPAKLTSRGTNVTFYASRNSSTRLWIFYDYKT